MSVSKKPQDTCNLIKSKHVLAATVLILAVMSSVLIFTVSLSDTSDADSTAEISVVANNDIMGSVTGSGTYNLNSTQIITALANTGYTFVQWDDGNDQSVRTITVTEDATYAAQFVANHYTVTLDNQSPTTPEDTSVTATYAQNLPNIVVPSRPITNSADISLE